MSWTPKTNGVDIIDAIDLNSAFAEIEETLDDKVSVVTGKGLSSNDFTNELKAKLDNLSNTHIVMIAGTGSTTSFILADNTEYRVDSNQVTGLSLILVGEAQYLEPTDIFCSSVIFSSEGNLTVNPISFSAICGDGISPILYSGDDCVDGAFTISASKRYTIMYYWDGVCMNGIVRGVAI